MDAILGAISAIYDAALDPSLWELALRKLCSVTDAVGFNLFLLDHHTGLIPLHTSVGIPNDILTGYSSHYVTLDPGIEYFVKNPKSPFFYNYQHTPEEEIDKDEYYTWLQRAGGTRYHLGVGFHFDARYSCIASAQRTRKAGHAQQSDMKLLGLFAPHLERAVRLDQRFRKTDLRAAAAFEILEKLPYGIFFLGGDGTVLFANETGERILARGDGLSLSQKQIVALHPAENRKLQSLIRASVESGKKEGLNSGGELSVSRKRPTIGYAVQVFPLASRFRLFTRDQPVALVLVGDPDRNLRLKAEELSALFNLTITEAHVAQLLAKGLRPAQVCQIESISANTLKTHRKRIFAKMGVETQAQLSHLINAI